MASARATAPRSTAAQLRSAEPKRPTGVLTAETITEDAIAARPCSGRCHGPASRAGHFHGPASRAGTGEASLRTYGWGEGLAGGDDAAARLSGRSARAFGRRPCPPSLAPDRRPP